jgi:hypothetical protein
MAALKNVGHGKRSRVGLPFSTPATNARIEHHARDCNKTQPVFKVTLGNRQDRRRLVLKADQLARV